MPSMPRVHAEASWPRVGDAEEGGRPVGPRSDSCSDSCIWEEGGRPDHARRNEGSRGGRGVGLGGRRVWQEGRQPVE